MPISDDHIHIATLQGDCDWPMNTSRDTANRIWRAAFIKSAAAGNPAEWHGAWSGRDPKTGETENQPPRVFYRVDRIDGRFVPVVTIADRNKELVYGLMLHALSKVMSVRLDRQHEAQDLVLPIRWHTSTEAVWPWLGQGLAVYETITPYYPAKAATNREPDWKDPLHVAWASSVLHSSLLTRLNGWGLNSNNNPARIPFVQVLHHEPVPVAWARPQQDKRFQTSGFKATFATKVLLPNGVGIGHHAAEGWGALRLVELRAPKHHERSTEE